MSARRMGGKDRAAETAPDEPGTGGDAGTDEDSIEILEVVGVDETTGAPPARRRAPARHAGDSPPPEGATPAPEDRPVDLGQALRDKEKYYDLFLRKQAEFDNFRKRTEKDRVEHRAGAIGDFMKDVLPVLDNLERALASSVRADSPLRQGVVLIHQQLLEVLMKEGLRPVETTGAIFDPHFHEAVETRPAEGCAPGSIIEEMQKGYTFNGRLLRPALVRVATGEGSDTSDPGGDRTPGGAHGGTAA